MAPAQSSNVALLAGPQLMGFFFDWALQGILCVQIYMYHLLFPHDSRAMKGFVYGVFVYEWIQTILITQTAFEIDVYGFGDRVSLTSFHNTWFSVTIMCAILSAAVQGYFCWRIWAFSCSKMLAGTIMFFAFSQMCAGVAGGIMLHTVSPNAARFSADTPLLTAWLVCAALVDVAIAACMSYYLLRAKSGLKASDDLVNRLVRFIIETGTLTATVAIFDAIAFTVIPNTLVYECPALVLAKVYANTLLASLNNRAIMRRFDPNDGTVCLDLRGMLVQWVQWRAFRRRLLARPILRGSSSGRSQPNVVRAAGEPHALGIRARRIRLWRHARLCSAVGREGLSGRRGERGGDARTRERECQPVA